MRANSSFPCPRCKSMAYPCQCEQLVNALNWSKKAQKESVERPLEEQERLRARVEQLEKIERAYRELCWGLDLPEGKTTIPVSNGRVISVWRKGMFAGVVLLREAEPGHLFASFPEGADVQTVRTAGYRTRIFEQVAALEPVDLPVLIWENDGNGHTVAKDYAQYLREKATQEGAQ
jgi:hypothetical protein